MMSSALRLVGLSYSTDYLVSRITKLAQCGQCKIGCSHKKYSHKKSVPLKLLDFLGCKHSVCYVGIKLAVKVVKLVAECTRKKI